MQGRARQLRHSGFAEGRDYIAIEFDSLNLANQNQRGGDRRTKQYALTLRVMEAYDAWSPARFLGRVCAHQAQVLA